MPRSPPSSTCTPTSSASTSMRTAANVQRTMSSSAGSVPHAPTVEHRHDDGRARICSRRSCAGAISRAASRLASSGRRGQIRAVAGSANTPTVRPSRTSSATSAPGTRLSGPPASRPCIQSASLELTCSRRSGKHTRTWATNSHTRATPHGRLTGAARRSRRSGGTSARSTTRCGAPGSPRAVSPAHAATSNGPASVDITNGTAPVGRHQPTEQSPTAIPLLARAHTSAAGRRGHRQQPKSRAVPASTPAPQFGRQRKRGRVAVGGVWPRSRHATGGASRRGKQASGRWRETCLSERNALDERSRTRSRRSNSDGCD
jgi:hypothetical protein